MAASKISPITTAGICGVVNEVDGPANDGLFPSDALLELLSFLPDQEVGIEIYSCPSGPDGVACFEFTSYEFYHSSCVPVTLDVTGRGKPCARYSPSSVAKSIYCYDPCTVIPTK